MFEVFDRDLRWSSPTHAISPVPEALPSSTTSWLAWLSYMMPSIHHNSSSALVVAVAEKTTCVDCLPHNSYWLIFKDEEGWKFFDSVARHHEGMNEEKDCQ